METWIVGVSGGPDSMYLLYELLSRGYDVVIAHVNYGIRIESDAEMDMVLSYANRHNLKVHTKLFNNEKHGNFQKVARDFRYTFYKELIHQYQAKGVALGHHFDDDLETYVMQIESDRKSMYPGLNVHSKVMGMDVWRPLLDITKNQIIERCHDLDIPYAIDASNFELVYTRNKVRDTLENMNVQDKKALIQRLFEAKEKQNEYLNILKAYMIHENPVSVKQFLDIPEMYKIDVLRSYLNDHGIDPFEMREVYLDHLIALIHKGNAKEKIGDYIFSVSYGEICVFKPETFVYELDELWYHETDHYEIKSKGEVIEGIHLIADDFPIKIRSPKKGDRIEMRFGTKSVNRYFIDRKIPFHRRHLCCVIENSVKEVVFVMGLGCDVRHYANNPKYFVVKLGKL